jgi:serine protease AprX
MHSCLRPGHDRRKTVWSIKGALSLSLLVLLGFAPGVAAAPNPTGRASKSDSEVSRRKNANPNEVTSVIVRLKPGAKLPAVFKQYARLRGKLGIINGQVLDLPNRVIRQLEAHPDIFLIDHNRNTSMDNYRTSLTIGSYAVQRSLGLTGSGVGVAVLDSGIAAWHDDLTNRSSVVYPYGDQRVSAFVDFVNSRTTPYDDQGHGTHVSGIIAGNGADSFGQKAGVAPDASLVSLKVLDANGQGTISSIIAALDWVLANHVAYNIRVVNMSVGAGITESYNTDPLTLAAKRVVDAGIVVVSAAGNLGKNAQGEPQYGGIRAPGNAPWVLTVGASSSNGTANRGDDVMAGFSSRGPTYLDWSAKPDLVAPGVGTVSLADPTSAYYTTKAQYLLDGSISTPFRPYLSLSGTSMAAPVVAGVVAVMMQANPALTPNAVKGILQYTSEWHADYNALTEGAGFLNAVGAVRLARYLAHPQAGSSYPMEAMWSKHIIWGNHMLSGGIILPAGNAWAASTTWGVAKTDDDDNIVWGTRADDDDNIVWGTDGDDNIVWGTDDDDNIVWGTAVNGVIVWSSSASGDVQILHWGDAFDRLSDAEIFTILNWVGGGSLPVVLVSPPVLDAGVEPPSDVLGEPLTDVILDEQLGDVILDAQPGDVILDPSTEVVLDPSTDVILDPTTDVVLEPSSELYVASPDASEVVSGQVVF